MNRLPIWMLLAVVGLLAGAQADLCPDSELAKYAPLVPSSNDPNHYLTDCGQVTGFHLLASTDKATNTTTQQLTKMCAVTACHQTIQALGRVDPSDCDLVLVDTATTRVVINLKQLVDQFEPFCDSLEQVKRELQQPVSTTAKPTTPSPWTTSTTAPQKTTSVPWMTNAPSNTPAATDPNSVWRTTPPQTSSTKDPNSAWTHKTSDANLHHIGGLVTVVGFLTAVQML